VPDLKRDAFETVKEFQKRISDCKPVLAGQADLLKDKYDINTGVFPVKISWKEWAEPFVNKSKEVHIIAERDLASSISIELIYMPLTSRLRLKQYFIKNLNTPVVQSLLTVY